MLAGNLAGTIAGSSQIATIFSGNAFLAPTDAAISTADRL
jgi:hypothetical protein